MLFRSRGHRDEEDAVETGVLADRCLVLLLVVHAFHNASPRGPRLAEIGQGRLLRPCGRAVCGSSLARQDDPRTVQARAIGDTIDTIMCGQ